MIQQHGDISHIFSQTNVPKTTAKVATAHRASAFIFPLRSHIVWLDFLLAPFFTLRVVSAFKLMHMYGRAGALMAHFSTSKLILMLLPTVTYCFIVVRCFFSCFTLLAAIIKDFYFSQATPKLISKTFSLFLPDDEATPCDLIAVSGYSLVVAFEDNDKTGNKRESRKCFSISCNFIHFWTAVSFIVLLEK